MASPINVLAMLAGFAVTARTPARTGTPITLFFASDTTSARSSTDTSGGRMLGRHKLADAQRTVCQPAGSTPAGRFRVTQRFQVALEVPQDDAPPALWISPNSLAERPPPPPDTSQGPFGCDCTDLDGRHGPRYENSESDSWVWSPDYYDAAWSWRAYIPDLFAGAGPCFACKYSGILTQWEPAWAVPHKGGVRLRSHELSLVRGYSSVIARALSTLSLTAPKPEPSVEHAATAKDLKELWASWVSYRQMCAGVILERLVGHGLIETVEREHPKLLSDLRSAAFFEQPPLGAWFRDTNMRISEIRSLIAVGVPVFYRWSPLVEEIFTAAPLRPAPKLLALLAAYRPVSRDSVAPKADDVNQAAKLKEDDDPFEMVESNSVSLAQRTKGDPIKVKTRGTFYPWDVPAADSSARRARRSSAGSLADVDWWSPDEASLHVEGFEQGLEQGLELAARRLAEGSGQSVEEVLAMLVHRRKPEYALVQDPSLAARLSATKGEPKRAGLITLLVLEVFSEQARIGFRTVRSNVRVITADKDDSVPELQRRMISEEQDPFGLKLFVYDVGVVGEELGKLVEGRHLDSVKEIVKFCLRNLIRFTMAIPHGGSSAMKYSAEASVHASWWVSPGPSTGDMLAHWRSTLGFLFLQRPRVFQAALVRGGVLARIARYISADGRFALLPTTTTRTLGCPQPLNKKLHFDWLDKDEVLLLLGSLGPEHNYSASLWPTLDLLDARYAGVWTIEYEGWFKSRVQELVTGKRNDKPARGLCSKADWEGILRNSAFA